MLTPADRAKGYQCDRCADAPTASPSRFATPMTHLARRLLVQPGMRTAEMLVLTAHKTDEAHLSEVMALMEAMGAPTVHVARDGDRYLALDGVHRLEAAKRLGLTPILVEVDVVPDDNDLDGGAYAGRPASEAIEYLLSGDGPDGAHYHVRCEESLST